MMKECIFGILLISTYVLLVESGGIHCYQCSVSPEVSDYNQPSQLCTHFDGSSKFQVYCPYSTLCMKRTTRYRVRNKTTVIVQRGCAPQKYTQPKYNEREKTWQSNQEIDENAYDVGCSISDDNGSPSSPSEFCYCLFHLCNGKSSVINSIDMFGTIILGIFIIELTCVQGIITAIL